MEEVEIFTMLCPEYGASCSGGCGNSIAESLCLNKPPSPNGQPPIPSVLDALLLLPAASIVAFIVAHFLEKSSVIFFFSAQFRNFLKAGADGVVIGRPMREQTGRAILISLLRVGEIAAALVA
jgi:hypothetical protein